MTMTVKELARMYNTSEKVIYAFEDLEIINIEYSRDDYESMIQERVESYDVELLEKLIYEVFYDEYSKRSNLQDKCRLTRKDVLLEYEETGSELALVLLQEIES